MKRIILLCLLLFAVSARQLWAQENLPLTSPEQQSSPEKTLDFYLSTAKTNAPLLSDLHNQIKSLGFDSSKLKASYGPQVTANASLLYAPVIKGWGYDNAITNGQDATGTIAVTKEIIGKNNLETRLNSFSIQQKLLGSQMALTNKTLAQNVTQQYITSYGDQQQYKLTQEVDAFLQQEDQVLKKLTETANFKQTDYLTFKVALEQQHLLVAQAKAQSLNGLGTLNYLCGIQDSSYSELTRPILEDSALRPFEQTTYYQGSLLDSLKNDNNAKIIDLNYQPKVNLFADGGYQSSLVYQAHKNFGASVGLNLTLPLYDGKQRKTSLLQNQLLEQSRQKYTDFYRSQYNQQALQLIQQINQYDQLIQRAEKQLVYCKTLIEANRRQLTTGDVRILDYLLSINNYLNLRSAMIQNDMTRLSLVHQLHNIILK